MNDLVAHLAELARALRADGVRVAAGDEIDALRALERSDLGDPSEVRLTLLCTFRIRRQHQALFDKLFDRLWRGRGHAVPGRTRLESEPHGPGGTPRPWPFAAGTAPTIDTTDADEPGFTQAVLLRKKSFERCTERDLAEMEPLLERLADKLATRKSRRLVPAIRGRADLRRSLRRSLATGGEILTLARRDRPIERPRLVFLCDTSGSMEMHTRFLLAFARALRRVAPGTEVFVFNTELVRVTPWLAGRQELVLDRLARGVRDWSGGTRIGESLDAFAAQHLAERVDARTTVLIFSDGLDRGDTGLIAGAMRKIRARARRVIWMNPLLSDPRYRPTARGMAVALPFVDHLAPAHDLETLGRVVATLRD